MPWNYDDYIVILLQAGLDHCDSSQLEIYDPLKVRVKSGYVSLDRTTKNVTIDLIMITDEWQGKESTSPFTYNGTFRYIEADPAKGKINREYLQDSNKNKESYFYYRR